MLLLVLLFRTSSGLASAYGIAVSTTMVCDGIMGFVVIWKLWNWKAATAAALIVPFVVVDMTFFAANLLKLLEGAWVPLLFGAVVVVLIRNYEPKRENSAMDEFKREMRALSPDARRGTDARLRPRDRDSRE